MLLKRNSSHHHLHSQDRPEDIQSTYAAGLDQRFGIESDPSTQMANTNLFGSMAQERNNEIAFNQHFGVNDQDESVDLVGQFGLGSAQDDSFAFMTQESGEPCLSLQEDETHVHQALEQESCAAIAGNSTSFAMVADEEDLESSAFNTFSNRSEHDIALDNSCDMLLESEESLSRDDLGRTLEPAQSIQGASKEQVELDFVPSDEHEAAAKLIAEMMLGRDPLANLTAEVPAESDLSNNDTLSNDPPVQEPTEIGGESIVHEVEVAQEAALELSDDEDNDLLVNKSIKELKHKIELVDEDSLPSLTLLEVEKDHEASLSELRNDAVVQAFVGDLSHSTTGTDPHFTLVRQQFSLLDSPDDGDELEQDLLSEEQQEDESSADINEFVTGNISTLRTGTDTITVSYGSSKIAANEDDTPEQPPIKVRNITCEPYKAPDQPLHYTSTLSTTRFDVEHPKLLPTLFKDIIRYFYVYALAMMLGVLCLVKVYQVQDTRDLTSRLNEVTFNNEELEKEWLNLLATRQNLSEHAKIRSVATRQLNMVSPRTENEHVISLH